MNALITYLCWFVAIGGAVWGGIHGMQKLTQWSDRKVALLATFFGCSAGLLIHAIGFITVPTTGAWAWVASGFFGLLAAFFAAGGTDLNLIKATLAKGSPE